MARSPDPARDLFSTLIDANADAFAGGRYEVAYHLLMAALHEAQDRGAPDRLELVELTAATQQRQIDESAPTHPLSSTSARLHGKVAEGIYTVAARQAAARAALARRRPEVRKG